MHIQKLLAENKERMDAALVEFFSTQQEESFEIDPILVDILQIVEQQVMRGGKRIRPLFCRLGYAVAGGGPPDTAEIVHAGVSVELIHQFLLFHDDIADQDDLRYGELSLHETYKAILEKKSGSPVGHYGEAMALGTGDWVYTLAMQNLYALNFPKARIVAAGKVITRYLSQTVAGWMQQFYTINTPLQAVSIDDYLRSTRLVTAYYTVEGPLKVGTALAGNQQYDQILAEYAIHIGLAFQIQDDVLGMFGESSKTGKPVGNDFREGKKTMLVLLAYERAGKQDKRFLAKTLGLPLKDHELKRVQEIMVSTQAYEDAKQLARKYAVDGIAVLQQLQDEVDSEAVEILAGIATFLVEREY